MHKFSYRIVLHIGVLPKTFDSVVQGLYEDFRTSLVILFSSVCLSYRFQVHIITSGTQHDNEIRALRSLYSYSQSDDETSEKSFTVVDEDSDMTLDLAKAEPLSVNLCTLNARTSGNESGSERAEAGSSECSSEPALEVVLRVPLERHESHDEQRAPAAASAAAAEEDEQIESVSVYEEAPQTAAACRCDPSRVEQLLETARDRDPYALCPAAAADSDSVSGSSFERCHGSDEKTQVEQQEAQSHTARVSAERSLQGSADRALVAVPEHLPLESIWRADARERSAADELRESRAGFPVDPGGDGEAFAAQVAAEAPDAQLREARMYEWLVEQKRLAFEGALGMQSLFGDGELMQQSVASSFTLFSETLSLSLPEFGYARVLLTASPRLDSHLSHFMCAKLPHPALAGFEFRHVLSADDPRRLALFSKIAAQQLSSEHAGQQHSFEEAGELTLYGSWLPTRLAHVESFNELSRRLYRSADSSAACKTECSGADLLALLTQTLQLIHFLYGAHFAPRFSEPSAFLDKLCILWRSEGSADVAPIGQRAPLVLLTRPERLFDAPGERQPPTRADAFAPSSFADRVGQAIALACTLYLQLYGQPAPLPNLAGARDVAEEPPPPAAFERGPSASESESESGLEAEAEAVIDPVYSKLLFEVAFFFAHQTRLADRLGPMPDSQANRLLALLDALQASRSLPVSLLPLHTSIILCVLILFS